MKTTRKRLVFNRPVKGRGFYAPKYSKKVTGFVKFIGGSYIRLVEKMGPVYINGLDNLIDAYSDFEHSDRRLLIAFRHPSLKDPTVLGYALNVLLPKMAKKCGKSLDFSPHTRFLYGKDVLNWAGYLAAWFFPKLGFIPVVNEGINREGLNLLRKEVAEGVFPIALAPEGQVTYHMFKCAPIASGVISLAQWVLEAGKEVSILPVAIAYNYTYKPEKCVSEILSKWEKETNVVLDPPKSKPSIYDYLMEATHQTLVILEEFYRFPLKSSDEYRNKQALKERLHGVCDACLKAAEVMNGLSSNGNFLQRIFKTRNQGMGEIFPDNFSPGEMSPIERSISDFRSLEAHIYLRHSQIVDILEYVDPDYISLDGQRERWCEYSLDLLDVINRLKGGNINTRYYPKGQEAVVIVEEPIKAEKYFKSDQKKKLVHRKLDKVLYEKLEYMSGNIDLSTFK